MEVLLHRLHKCNEAGGTQDSFKAQNLKEYVWQNAPLQSSDLSLFSCELENIGGCNIAGCDIPKITAKIFEEKLFLCPLSPPCISYFQHAYCTCYGNLGQLLMLCLTVKLIVLQHVPYLSLIYTITKTSVMKFKKNLALNP